MPCGGAHCEQTDVDNKYLGIKMRCCVRDVDLSIRVAGFLIERSVPRRYAKTHSRSTARLVSAQTDSSLHPCLAHRESGYVSYFKI